MKKIMLAVIALAAGQVYAGGFELPDLQQIKAMDAPSLTAPVQTREYSYGPDENTPFIREYIQKSGANLKEVQQFLRDQGEDTPVTGMLYAAGLEDLRVRVAVYLDLSNAAVKFGADANSDKLASHISDPVKKERLIKWMIENKIIKVPSPAVTTFVYAKAYAAQRAKAVSDLIGGSGKRAYVAGNDPSAGATAQATDAALKNAVLAGHSFAMDADIIAQEMNNSETVVPFGLELARASVVAGRSVFNWLLVSAYMKDESALPRANLERLRDLVRKRLAAGEPLLASLKRPLQRAEAARCAGCGELSIKSLLAPFYDYMDADVSAWKEAVDLITRPAIFSGTDFREDPVFKNRTFSYYAYFGDAGGKGWKVAQVAEGLLPRMRSQLVNEPALLDQIASADRVGRSEVVGAVYGFGARDPIFVTRSQAEDLTALLRIIRDSIR